MSAAPCGLDLRNVFIYDFGIRIKTNTESARLILLLLAKLRESFGEVLDEFDRARVFAVLVVDGEISHADGLAFDVAVELHAIALLRLEIGDELLDDRHDVHGMAVVDLAVQGEARTCEHLPGV